jgi:hypothetical protein
VTDDSATGRVVVSYASQDATVAGTLCMAIVNAIDEWRMLVLSKHAIDSPHVLREVKNLQPNPRYRALLGKLNLPN